jgi:HAD superfamily hydrolase (TIGR01484 family)
VRHLFVTDLDDTLLSAGAMPREMLSSLRRIIDSGAAFTIATARGLRAALGPLDHAIPKLPVIALRGAVVAYADGSEPAVNGLDRELVIPIGRLGDELGAAWCLLATDGHKEVVFAPSRRDGFTDWSIQTADYFRAEVSVLDGLSAETDQLHYIRVVFCSTVEKCERLNRLMALQYSSVSSVIVESRDMSGFAWLEVGASTATKAHAVKYLASRLGYSMKDVVYYGDAANDLEVMSLVGEAVAVANAEPDVLHAADRVIGEAKSGAVVLDLLERLDLSNA